MADRSPGRRGAPASRTLALSILFAPAAALADTAPTIDTEDATLGSVDVGERRLHPIFGVDIRNGDFARGGYDDDAANLQRLPVHLQAGLDYAIHVDANGKADAWLLATSSNGLHSPASYETVRPRIWYESNNLIGVVAEPTKGFRIGAAYAIKTSPNAVSGTSHEASLTMAFEAKHGIGFLHPSFVATVHPILGKGLYTQAGLDPSFKLTPSKNGLSLGVPVSFGVGWSGFYEAGTGTLLFGAAGLSLSKPLTLGAVHAKLQASAQALIRDHRLSQLGSAGKDAETSTVVPFAQVGISMAL